MLPRTFFSNAMILKDEFTVPITQNIPFSFHCTLEDLLWYNFVDIRFGRIFPLQILSLFTPLDVFHFKQFVSDYLNVVLSVSKLVCFRLKQSGYYRSLFSILLIHT